MAQKYRILNDDEVTKVGDILISMGKKEKMFWNDVQCMVIDGLSPNKVSTIINDVIEDIQFIIREVE